MKVAIYPGSFDPISNGHLDIINRASKLFDKLYILVSLNPKKHYVFSDEERVNLAKQACKDLNNVEVIASNELVVNVAKRVGACAIIRGLRNHKDLDDELELFQYNHNLNSDIETILMFPTLENLFVSSSAIKELAMFNEDISLYVPSIIVDEVNAKLKERLK